MMRKIRFEPGVTYFKPAGVPMAQLEEVTLSFEELEALRLQNIDGLGQEDSAKKMDVSQPTFNRVIKEARKKVTEALVNGNAIKIKGGDYKK